ncbi:hypothetical protein RHMOL_Rhmol08G0117700 [Rhododendron molle]|nr:hypothetical protein RHMOL_Rhmol08G0117700 [Rhododendron molle]KAI8542168.1 hypothetical protein RHMOL_Rhmol08G0117700 [Rhododendron molle]
MVVRVLFLRWDIIRNPSGLSSSVAHYYLETVKGPISIVRPSSTSLLQFPGGFSDWLIEFLMVYIYRCFGSPHYRVVIVSLCTLFVIMQGHTMTFFAAYSMALLPSPLWI